MIKKTISLLAITALVAQPMFALATSPTVDGATVGTTSATTATTSTTTANVILKTLKDYGLDQLAYMLAQKLGEKMATMAINKTTGGASSDKDPNYVKDFGALLSNIEKQQLDLYTTQLLGSNNPFAKDIAKGMLSGGGGDALPQFTLGKVLENEGDWESAAADISVAGDRGWDYYAQLAMPQNTPIGSSMLANEALAKSIRDKKTAESLKVTSSGFLPNAKCEKTLASVKNAATAANNANNQTYNTPEQATAAAQQNAQNQNTALGGITEDVAGCIEETISNPIATTQTLTNEAGKFGMDMTKNIQGWGQIVAGVFASLFNGFVNKGLSSLKGDYGQVKKTNIGGPEQVAAAGSNFSNVPVNIVDLRADLERSMDASVRNIDAVTALRTELLKVPVRLAMLDMCLPGNDMLGFDKRIDSYYSQQTEWLQKSSAMGSDDKRNIYQGLVSSMLERDYNIAKAETSQDMIDDDRNIPGAGSMRISINRFASRKTWWNASIDSLTRATDALAQLRQINTNLKLSLTNLQASEPGNFGWMSSLPSLPFTTAEWDLLSQTEQDQLYTWASAQGAIGSGQTHSQWVIKTVWDLWENPENFLSTAKWSDADSDGKSLHADTFLAAKNKVRLTFNSIGDIIPTEYEISKNEQQTESVISENEETDKLIHDCDKIRELIVGHPIGGIPSKLDTQYSGNLAGFRNDLIANKDVYFQSGAVKSSLNLPNVLNSTRTWADDGCRPNNEPPYSNGNTQANSSSGKNGGAHDNGYSCYGKFGYLYNVQKAESCGAFGCDFNEWIDAASNIYQSQPHISWPTELYWKSRTLKFTPDTSQYGNGWTVQDIGTEPQLADGGKQRATFCRFSSVMNMYVQRSAQAIDHNDKRMLCSSKWTDVSISEAVAMFIGSQLY